jgi:aryl-alcohol dehydrogenase-like predicted oxidoreductase
MEYRSVGRTGLKVSELCLGTMQFGWTADETTAREILDAFYEAGGNFVDTADIYSSWAPGNPGGVAEEILGRWMEDRRNRRQIVLATKVHGRMWAGPNGEGLGRKHIMEAVEDSLRRLRTSYIDLYQAHHDDPTTPIEETLRAFEDLVRQGKVLYVGASNYVASRFAEALQTSARLGLVRYDSLQPRYSLVHRAEFEQELAGICEREGVGVLPYSPLAGGFLTGKYRKDRPLPASVRLEGIRRRYFDDPRAWRTLEVADKLAEERGCTVAQVALAWLLGRPAVTAPIVGANSVAQLRESLGASGLRLTREEMERLDLVSRGL